MTAERRQRDRAAGVAGAAAARDDGQAELDAGLHQRRHFLFGVRIEDDEGILDAPVGGIGHVRDAGQAVEGDVVRRVCFASTFSACRPALGGFLEAALEGVDRRLRGVDQLQHALVALAALVDLVQAMAQRVDQRPAALAVGQQVVFR